MNNQNNKKVILLQGKHEYCYLEIIADREKLITQAFSKANFLPERYGEVLFRGKGYPPIAVKNAAENHFNDI